MECGNLFSSMRKWGFDADLNSVADLIRQGDVGQISMVRLKGNDVLVSGWHIREKAAAEELELHKIMVSLKKDLDVPEQWEQFDIKGLENRIRSVNWLSEKNEQLLKKLGSQHKVDEYIGTILYQLAYLNENPSLDAKKIYDLLMFKYFINTPLEALMPKQEADAIKREHFRKISIDPASKMAIDVNQVYNVLDERYTRIAIGIEDIFRWVKVDHAKKDKDGVSVLEIIPGSEGYDLKKCIDKVGIRNPGMVKADYLTLFQLSQGNRVVMTLERDGMLGKRVFYADPVNDRLSVDIKETAKRGFYEAINISQSRSNKEDDDDRVRGRKR